MISLAFLFSNMAKIAPQKNWIWSVNLDWLYNFCANPFPAICSSPNSAWHVACFKMDFGHPKATLRVTGYQMNDWVSFFAKLRSGLEPVNFQKLLPSPCGPLTTRIKKNAWKDAEKCALAEEKSYVCFLADCRTRFTLLLRFLDATQHEA